MKNGTSIQDYIKISSRAKTKINWWDLPKYRRIKLEIDFQKKLFQELIKMYPKTYTKLLGKSKFMSREYTKSQRAMTIGTLKITLKLLNIKYSSINEKIEKISGIENPKTPFKLDNEIGAEIRLAFLSDGHNPSDPTKNLKYQAGEIESHKRIIELSNLLLGNFNVRTEKSNWKNSYQSYFPCVMGDILEFGGVSRGRKTKFNPSLPNDIIKNDTLLISALRRSFTDEGSCYPKYNSIRIERNVEITNFINKMNIKLPLEEEVYISKLKNINFDKLKNNLILGEYLGLNKLGINAKLKPIKVRKNRNGTITLTWLLDITRVVDIKTFRKKIGFLLENKNHKIDEILQNYRKYNRLQDSLESIKYLTETNESFSYQEFAKYINVHKDRGLFHLRRLIKDGYVIREGKNIYRGVKFDRNTG